MQTRRRESTCPCRRCLTITKPPAPSLRTVGAPIHNAPPRATAIHVHVDPETIVDAYLPALVQPGHSSKHQAIYIQQAPITGLAIDKKSHLRAIGARRRACSRERSRGGRNPHTGQRNNNSFTASTRRKRTSNPQVRVRDVPDVSVYLPLGHAIQALAPIPE